MGDADDTQLNGFAEVVIPKCPSATYLMCFFHVMLNVKTKAKTLTESDRKLVYKHVYRIHHTRNHVDANDEVADALRAWSAQLSLKAFLQYFKQEWPASGFNRWQCYQSAISHAKTDKQSYRAVQQGFQARLHAPSIAPFKLAYAEDATVVQDEGGCDPRLQGIQRGHPGFPRRLKYLRKAGLLSHKRVQQASLSFIMYDNATESHVLVKQHGIQKSTFPLT